MAPPPMIPTLRRSLPLRLAVMWCPPSVETLEHRARIVRGEDALVVLSRARAADRAPLAKAHAVPRAGPVRDEVGDLSAVPGDSQSECVAPKQLARWRTQDPADARFIDQDVAAPEPDGELTDAPRAGQVGHPDVPDL